MLKKVHHYYYFTLLLCLSWGIFCTNTLASTTQVADHCSIDTIYTTISPCDENGAYFIHFFFDGTQIPLTEDVFSVTLSNQNFTETFNFIDAPYSIGPFLPNPFSDSLIIDYVSNGINCSYTHPLPIVSCSNTTDCHLDARFEGYEQMIFCEGDALQLFATSTLNDGASFSWSVNGQVVNHTSNLDYILTNSGVYHISLEVQAANDLNQLCRATHSTTVVVKASNHCPIIDTCQIKAQFTPPPTTTACPNEALTFLNTSTGANQFNWYVNDVLINNQAHFQYTFPEEGVYTVRLLAFQYEQISCTDESSFAISVQNDGSCMSMARCQAVADFTPLITKPICVGETIVFDNLSQNANVYEWTINDTLFYVGENLPYAFPEEGTYYIQLKATHNQFSGCFDTKTIAIQVLSTNVCGSCTGEDCVFPGDGNADGLVNSQDMLTIAQAYNQAGHSRTNAQTTFIGQHSSDWATTNPNNINHKYADTNGDGIINTSDLAVVAQNYSVIPSLHPSLAAFRSTEQQLSSGKLVMPKPEDDKSWGKSAATNTALRLRPVLLNQAETTDGKLFLDIGIILEHEGSDAVAEGVYGVSFSYHYEAPDSTSASVSYKNNATGWQSWLGDINSTNPQNLLTAVDVLFLTPDQQSGAIEIGMAKQATAPISGSGVLSRVGQIATIDDWVFKTMGDIYSPTLDILIDNIEILTVDGVIQGTSTLTSIPLRNQTHTLSLKAYLEGSYEVATGAMRTTLATTHQLPLQQPFNTAPWNYYGVEEIEDFSNIPAGVVDWVLVELVQDNTPFQIVEQRAALLTANGNIIDANGVTNGINLFRLQNNEGYRICLRHRNHLAVVSAAAISPTVGAFLSYDFSDATQVTGGQNQLELVDLVHNRYALFAADFSANGIISVQDFNAYYNELINYDGSQQYWGCDANLDGQLTIDDFNLYNKNSSIIGVNVVRY